MKRRLSRLFSQNSKGRSGGELQYIHRRAVSDPAVGQTTEALPKKAAVYSHERHIGTASHVSQRRGLCAHARSALWRRSADAVLRCRSQCAAPGAALLRSCRVGRATVCGVYECIFLPCASARQRGAHGLSSDHSDSIMGCNTLAALGGQRRGSRSVTAKVSAADACADEARRTSFFPTQSSGASLTGCS